MSNGNGNGKSVNDHINEALVSHDVTLQRVTGDMQRRVDRRMTQLERDLKTLLVTVDVHGAQRKDSRERRMQMLRRESKRIITEAYSEINTMQRKDLRQLARLESKAMGKIIREELP